LLATEGIEIMATPTTQNEGAMQLVERARAGDQNAMGMLSEIGKNAQLGNSRAKSAYSLIVEYCRTHPVNNAIMGAEAQEALGVLKQPDNPIDQILNVLCSLPVIGDPLCIQAACVLLANGPQWNKARTKQADQLLAGAERNLFRFGVENSSDSSKIQPVAKTIPQQGIGFLCAGHCIGTARRIQLARLPQVPVSVLSPEVGWELGC
jgi:hypothetical protein